MSMHSLKRARLSSIESPKPAYSAAWYPRPTPKSSRPPLIRSIVAACSARRRGVWEGRATTAGAMRAPRPGAPPPPPRLLNLLQLGAEDVFVAPTARLLEQVESTELHCLASPIPIPDN